MPDELNKNEIIPMENFIHVTLSFLTDEHTIIHSIKKEIKKDFLLFEVHIECTCGRENCYKERKDKFLVQKLSVSGKDLKTGRGDIDYDLSHN